MSDAKISWIVRISSILKLLLSFRGSAMGFEHSSPIISQNLNYVKIGLESINSWDKKKKKKELDFYLNNCQN